MSCNRGWKNASAPVMRARHTTELAAKQDWTLERVLRHETGDSGENGNAPVVVTDHLVPDRSPAIQCPSLERFSEPGGAR